MVDAEYAGVLFTQAPDSAGLSLVELVTGTADKLVSATVRPHAFRYGRNTLNLIGTNVPPVDLKPLIDIGRRLETAFGVAQDIEWTYCAGKFLLVQSRDITANVEGADESGMQREWRRLLDIASGAPLDAVVFAQNEMSEVLPRPTPLSLSLMEALWASGGSVDLAARALNLEYPVHDRSPSYLITLFGRLYVDKREEQSRALRVSSLSRRRLNKAATAIETAFRDQFLVEFSGEMSLLEATDFDRLPTAELFNAVSRIRDNFIHRTHLEVSIINIAADLFMREAQTRLKAAQLDPVTYLVPSEPTEFERVVNEAEQLAPVERRAKLLAGIGHRATMDYELAQLRYREKPDEMGTLASAPSEIRQMADPTALQDAGKGLIETVHVAQRFETLKEDAKHHCARELTVLRNAIVALDRRLGLDGLSFYFTFEELSSLRTKETAELRGLAMERRELASLHARAPALPGRLTVVQLEDASAGMAIDNSPPDGRIIGTRVSGRGVVEGRACVFPGSDPEASTTIPGFQDGDIVVSNMVPPTWIPYFGRAGGFVCEIGGWLSHTAIVARERQVPLIVSAQGIEGIADGMRLRLHPDGFVEIVTSAPVAVAAE
jgi:phosphohistidine swiveling domain-containing protein